MEGSTIDKKDPAWRGKASTHGWVFDLVRKAMSGAGQQMRAQITEKNLQTLELVQKLGAAHVRSSAELSAENVALAKTLQSENEKLRAEIHEARQVAVRNAEEAFSVQQALERRLVRLEAEIAKKKK